MGATEDKDQGQWAGDAGKAALGASTPEIDSGGAEAGGSEAGGSEDRLSRFFAVDRMGATSSDPSKLLKRVLPWVTGVVLIAVLAWPFIRQSSDSVTLSYKDLVGKSEQVRIAGATYTGLDDQQRPFRVTAAEGMQERSDSDFAALQDVTAEMELSDQNQVTLTSESGRYDRSQNLLRLAQGIQVETTTGYVLNTEAALVDMATNTASGAAAVVGQAPFGNFTAQGFTLNVDTHHLVLQGGVKVRLDPGKRATDPQPPTAIAD